MHTFRQQQNKGINFFLQRTLENFFKVDYKTKTICHCSRIQCQPWSMVHSRRNAIYMSHIICLLFSCYKLITEQTLRQEWYIEPHFFLDRATKSERHQIKSILLLNNAQKFFFASSGLKKICRYEHQLNSTFIMRSFLLQVN